MELGNRGVGMALVMERTWKTDGKLRCDLVGLEKSDRDYSILKYVE